MDDKQPTQPTQPKIQETPPQEAPQQKGSNDPNFPSQDAGQDNKKDDTSNRELPPNPNMQKVSTDAYHTEKEIDPGNEHSHSENDGTATGGEKEDDFSNDEKHIHPPY